MEQMPIKLSDNIVIPCPLVQFNLRLAKKCLNCQFYQGIRGIEVNGEKIVDGEITSVQVVCGRPIARRLQQVVA